jgi:hypothetical protein
VRDGADALERLLDDLRVAHIAAHPLRRRVEVARCLASRVCGGMEMVEDPHGGTVLDELVHDVGADEAGAARHEDDAVGHGRRRLSAARSTGAGAAS